MGMLLCEQKFRDVWSSVGSIPDSYDIYRYLNLVRYSILDTFVVNVISSTYSGATWNDCAMSIYYFSKNCFAMKHSRENEIPIFFLKNPIFFLLKIQIFFSKIQNFSLGNQIFFRKHTKFWGCPCLYTTFRKHTKSGVWSLSEVPSFIVYAARNIPSISDTI